MDGVLFELSGVTVEGPDGRTRIAEFDACIPDHGITVVAGPSGSGKSTMLRLCNRLEVPDSGRVAYRGAPMEDMDPLELRRRVAMVFQRPTALPGSVADNLRIADPGTGEARVAAMLERVGLGGFADRRAAELSGGETQRMALARALLTDPEYVLFDEPTSSLDPSAARSIERLAAQLAEDGTPSCWVTHDLGQMRRLAHHLVVVVGGRVAQQGHLDDVLRSPSAEVASFLAGGDEE